LDEEGNIVRLVEKPKTPMGNLAIIGTYLFSNKVHSHRAHQAVFGVGELEITDAIQEMVNMGFSVKAEILNSWWLDTGKKDDILSANAKILDEYIQRDIKGTVTNSNVDGRVKVEADAQIINSTIRGPCIIGKKVLIETPSSGHTRALATAQNLQLKLEYCVIQDNVTIKDVERLKTV
jgi:glucose-1-phosphate thymidylyltransferase